MRQEVNLYQEGLRDRADYSDARHLGLGLIVVIIALALVTGVQAWRAQATEARVEAAAAQRDEVRRSFDQLQAQLRAMRDEAGQATEIDRRRAELAAKRRLLAHLEEGPMAARDTPLSAYFLDLARTPVEGLWLERIDVRAGGDTLRISGHARSGGRVPALLARIAEQTAFSGHAFRTVRIDRVEADGADRLDFLLASERAEKKR